MSLCRGQNNAVRVKIQQTQSS